MKTVQRIRRNGATKSTASQVQNRSHQKPEPISSSISVMFFDEVEGASMGNGISLNRDKVATIVKNAAQRGESIDAWLFRVITSAIPAKNHTRIGNTESKIELNGREIKRLQIAMSNGKKLVPLAEFNLSLNEWMSACQLKKEIEPRGVGRDFFREAICAKVAAYQPGGLMDLATQLDHAVTKLEVMAELISTHNDHGDMPAEGKAKKHFDFGKFLLMRNLVDDLAKMRDAIMNTAYLNKNGEVAS